MLDVLALIGKYVGYKEICPMNHNFKKSEPIQRPSNVYESKEIGNLHNICGEICKIEFIFAYIIIEKHMNNI